MLPAACFVALPAQPVPDGRSTGGLFFKAILLSCIGQNLTFSEAEMPGDHFS
jgi:hypothetical protein